MSERQMRDFRFVWRWRFNSWSCGYDAVYWYSIRPVFRRTLTASRVALKGVYMEAARTAETVVSYHKLHCITTHKTTTLISLALKTSSLHISSDAVESL